MRIKSVVESEEGPVEFTGDLHQEELRFVVEVGLNVLMANGSIPFVSKNNESIVGPGSRTEQ